MKFWLWALVFFGGITALALPVTYLFVASSLPNLEGEFDVDKLLRYRVEGERMADGHGRVGFKVKEITYSKPDFAELPKELVAVYLSQRGCPEYFATPKEGGVGWLWGLFSSAVFDTPGYGAAECERMFSMLLAEEVGANTKLQRAVAAAKIHRLLEKDQLVAYHMSTLWFANGVVGVDAATQKIFHKRATELTLGEMAELAIALPPNGLYEDIVTCKNPPLILRAREKVLRRLVNDALVSQESADKAQGEKLGCLANG